MIYPYYSLARKRAEQREQQMIYLIGRCQALLGALARARVRAGQAPAGQPDQEPRLKPRT